MSSRYSICATAEQVRERFAVDTPAGYTPRFNAAPGHLLPVITNSGPQGLSFFYWGLDPAWAHSRPITEKITHVRLERIPEKPMYRKTLAQRRCLVPADGFYEWKKIGKKTVIPYRFTRPDRNLFAFAGLWEEYDDGEEHFHTFTIITLPEPVEGAERLPAILNAGDEKAWLDNTLTESAWLSLIKPYAPSQLDSYTVSPRINSLTANDPGLIAPAPPADQFGNLTLFD